MEGLGSISTQSLQHPELIRTQQIRASYQGYLLPEWFHVYSKFHSEISPPNCLLKWSRGTPSYAFRSPKGLHFSAKFCSSSVHELSLMKYVEVSSPKANKKDVEIISSTMVKVFFNNLNLRRSNYFTQFFFHFSNPYAQSHQSENIPPPRYNQKTFLCSSKFPLQVASLIPEGTQKDLFGMDDFPPRHVDFQIQKENTWENGSNTQTQAKDVKYSKENDQ